MTPTERRKVAAQLRVVAEQIWALQESGAPVPRPAWLLAYCFPADRIWVAMTPIEADYDPDAPLALLFLAAMVEAGDWQ